MRPEIHGSRPAGGAPSTRLNLSALFVSGAVWIASTSARAEDAVTLQRLEAKIQQLEARHENEIKTLRAEIRRLRKQKPAAAAAVQPPAAEPPRSSLLPPGLPPPATP